ncbi:hypothetical protein A4R29_15385 [Mesorhizobium ciceri biovar biserrulae]|nr:hypothetical protein A4R29_15385 [Mesorhizobium ciceri biovar biserrulae]
MLPLIAVGLVPPAVIHAVGRLVAPRIKPIQVVFGALRYCVGSMNQRSDFGKPIQLVLGGTTTLPVRRRGLHPFTLLTALDAALQILDLCFHLAELIHVIPLNTVTILQERTDAIGAGVRLQPGKAVFNLIVDIVDGFFQRPGLVIEKFECALAVHVLSFVLWRNYAARDPCCSED